MALRETIDAFAVPAGAAPGTALLNKLQLSATLRGERVGLPGWQFHAQVIRLDGQSLSARLGDIQTGDNIEAPRALRLFEAYFAKTIGELIHALSEPRPECDALDDLTSLR